MDVKKKSKNDMENESISLFRFMQIEKRNSL